MQAVMKSFVVIGSDPAKPERFLAYMVPTPDEVRGDEVEDPTTYLVNFDEDSAYYLPLPTKLLLQKKRAKEGRPLSPSPGPTRLASSSPLAGSPASSRPASTPSTLMLAPPSTSSPSSSTMPLRFWSWLAMRRGTTRRIGLFRGIYRWL